MARLYLPVKAVAVAAAGVLLAGGGVAVAKPDSHSDTGGGKPSPGASAASSGNPPGNSGSSHGKPATTPGGNSPGEPKSLPDAASPVAGAATGKPKSVAASVLSPHGQGAAADADIEIPSATAIPTAAPAATVTVPVDAAAVTTPSAPAQDRHYTPAPSDLRSQSGRADHNGAGLTAPAPRLDRAPTQAPEETAHPGTAAPPSASAAAVAALSVPRPQSSGDRSGTSSAPVAEGSRVGRVAGHVAEKLREALREVTLKELALAALPGLLGILFFFSTGIGLGHRQARFGFALQSTGALRFATRGPVGVVRPGGFLAVPARAGRRSGIGPRRSTAALLNRAA